MNFSSLYLQRWLRSLLCRFESSSDNGRLQGNVLSEGPAQVLLADVSLDACHLDLLTGLPNRTALQLEVEGRLNRSLAGKNCLAVLIIDDLRGVNQIYGHDVGDAVTREFAIIMRQLVRSHDIVAKLNGEVFAIYFENTSPEQAYLICERICRVLAGAPLATPAGRLRVTASGGVAVLRKEGLDASLNAAVATLARAKRGGKDQLLLAA